MATNQNENISRDMEKNTVIHMVVEVKDYMIN